MLVLTITITVLFYIAALYVSYISVAILYQGIRYKLLLPTLKSSVFLGVAYTSIISDVVLYSENMYPFVLTKNLLLFILIVVSLTTSVGRKETRNTNEHY